MFPVEGETSAEWRGEGGKSLGIRATGAHLIECVCKCGDSDRGNGYEKNTLKLKINEC